MTRRGRCGEALDMEVVRFAVQFPAEGPSRSVCRMASPEFGCAAWVATAQTEMVASRDVFSNTSAWDAG